MCDHRSPFLFDPARFRITRVWDGEKYGYIDSHSTTGSTRLKNTKALKPSAESQPPLSKPIARRNRASVFLKKGLAALAHLLWVMQHGFGREIPDRPVAVGTMPSSHRWASGCRHHAIGSLRCVAYACMHACMAVLACPLRTLCMCVCVCV